MLLFIILFAPGALATLYYSYLIKRSFAPHEFVGLILGFSFLVNLLCFAFFYVSGLATFDLSKLPFTVSFLMKYSGISLVVLILLPNILRILPGKIRQIQSTL